ncbi:MAG: type II toxin-antitoxin system VapC family toxin [Rhodospirillaceae bacterium]|nr:type II toxin-antitoxin system VapC family toxin [Rhodospirillaceae bacterium]MDD9996862.1 type II toxin-antitoxin system VapC family toxin [Rhodospirillaceae bacterium]
MTGYAIDASAVLAIIGAEPGSDYVLDRLTRCRISAVNLAEVASILSDRGASDFAVSETLNDLDIDCVPFDPRQALVSASLRRKTRTFGLSLGDRACLALAETGKLTALTADWIWTDAGRAAEVEVDVIPGRGDGESAR